MLAERRASGGPPCGREARAGQDWRDVASPMLLPLINVGGQEFTGRGRSNPGAAVFDEIEQRGVADGTVLRALATTLLNLADDPTAAVRRAHLVLGWKPRRWLGILIRKILSRPDLQTGRLGCRNLAILLSGIERLGNEISYGVHLDLSHLPAPRMRRDSGFATGPLVELNTVGDCLAWLGLSPEDLDWFTGSRGEPGRTARGPGSRPGLNGPLRNYHLEWIPKSSGGVRLLEVPKRRLKATQRLIQRDILCHIPPHDAAHAYRAERSIVTALEPHSGQQTVWHLDLTNFFWSIGAGKVRRLFRRIGYPEGVAEALTHLTTSRIPLGALAESPLAEDERQKLMARHLPQGAPTSPALANLCAFRLDRRLSALASRYQVRYTRYADDLLFSGDRRFRRRLETFRVTVLAILIDEGFQIRRRKTRVLHCGGRQQIAGLVLNDKVGIPRDDYDRLRAILYNCVRNGPDSQNREGHPNFRQHLLGRLGWVAFVSPARGRKLRELFERIVWPRSTTDDEPPSVDGIPAGS